MSAALKCIEDRDEDERLIARALEIFGVPPCLAAKR